MKFHETSHRRSGAEKTGKRRRARGDGRWTSLRAAGADEAGEKQGQSAQVPATSGQDTDVTVIPDGEAAGERGKDQAQQKRIMPLKRPKLTPNLDVRAEFDLETNGAGKTDSRQKECLLHLSRQCSFVHGRCSCCGSDGMWIQ